jgi:hypothetical protein
MNEQPLALSSRIFPVVGLWIATAATLLTVALLWNSLKRRDGELDALAEQNNQLKQQLMAANSELDFFKTGDFSKTTKQTDEKPLRSIAEPAPETETLLLEEPTLSQTASGLVARFQFKPVENTELPRQITLVVRIPSHSSAKILAIKPVSKTGYSSVEYLVNAKGDLGMIEGSPSDLSALEFELTVSEAVKATVRGSEGIKDFELDITATSCTVRQL